MKIILLLSIVSFLYSENSCAQKLLGHYGSIEVRMCEPFSVVEFLFFDDGTFKRIRYNEYVSKGEYVKKGDTLYITKGQIPSNDHQSISTTYLMVGDSCIVDLDYYYDYFRVDKSNISAIKKGNYKSGNLYRIYSKRRKMYFPQRKSSSKEEISAVEEILSMMIQSDIFSEVFDTKIVPFESYFELTNQNINLKIPNKKVEFLPSDEIDLLDDTYFSFYHFNQLSNGDYSILIQLNQPSFENPLLYFKASKVDEKWTFISKGFK